MIRNADRDSKQYYRYKNILGDDVGSLADFRHTIGASTDAQGTFLLHRVKGYDNLVASYLGYVNDTLRV